ERRLSPISAAGIDRGQTNRLVALAGHRRRLGGMLVRPSREHDIDTIAEVFVASFGGLTFLPTLHTDGQTRAWFRTVMVRSHDVWIAETEHRVVGFVALKDDLVGHLYVHPDAQNRGVGTALLDRAKLERTIGFRLWTFQRNEGARRFYERHG